MNWILGLIIGCMIYALSRSGKMVRKLRIENAKFSEELARSIVSLYDLYKPYVYEELSLMLEAGLPAFNPLFMEPSDILIRLSCYATKLDMLDKGVLCKIVREWQSDERIKSLAKSQMSSRERDLLLSELSDKKIH